MGKVRPAGVTGEEDEENLLGEGDEEADIPWDDELAQWEEDESYQHTTLKITLFRQPKRGGEREKIWEYEDEIAGTHAIGLRFGGGRYSVYGRILRDGKVIKRIRRHFVLGESYNEAARLNAAQQAPQMAASVPQANPWNLETFARGVQIALPLIAALKEFLSPSDKLGNAQETAKMINGILMDSAKAQIGFVREVKKDLVQMGNPQATPQSDEESPEEFKAYLLEALKEYGPTLIEAAGLKLKSALSIMKKDDVFAALANSPQLFERVYNLAINDPEVTDADKVMIEKVLTKLSTHGIGFNIPKSRIQAANGHARPQAAQAA